MLGDQARSHQDHSLNYDDITIEMPPESQSPTSINKIPFRAPADPKCSGGEQVDKPQGPACALEKSLGYPQYGG
jgi:hypothetical protein